MSGEPERYRDPRRLRIASFIYAIGTVLTALLATFGPRRAGDVVFFAAAAAVLMAVGAVMSWRKATALKGDKRVVD
jgi:hypothetical protein